MLEGEALVAEVRDGFAAGVGHAHSYCQAEHQRLNYRTTSARVVRIDVQRMLVHRQQREPDVIVLGDGPAGPMLVDVAGLELLVIAPERHRQVLSLRYLRSRLRAMISRCSSLVPPPITSSGASR